MMPADLTDQELEDMIDKLEDRIETTQTLLSDNDDVTIASVLNQTLVKYTSQYKLCLIER